MRKKHFQFFLFVMLLSSQVMAQKKQPDFHHVEPPFWWAGMKNTSVQILFHNSSSSISDYQPAVSYDGVSLAEVKKVANPHYLFVTLELSPDVKPGMLPIVFKQGKRSITYWYELKSRTDGTNRAQGFNSSDVIYLIFPDRFANGDKGNDSVTGMLEGYDREKGEGRHGGDIRGITEHLDYISDLGITAVWLNPVLENNQPRASYHGYAITDLYNVDRRFGGNSEYLRFIERSHERGIKVIQDMVMNHIGSEHWLVKDPPEKDWIHQFPEFTRSNYRGVAVADPYRSQRDEMLMSDGWFDKAMPDVNQKNPLFAKYLIQNTIWWIEHAGIDGIRMDTYPYPDKHFMSAWVSEVKTEFPAFGIVGEVWLNNVASTAYWANGMANKDGYRSNLPSVTDFPFCFAVHQALNEQPGWENGLARLYNLLSQDFIYPDANSNLTFLDNHDMTRFFLSAGRDISKFKMGLAFLLTTRGIPQLYYGTELLMDGDGAHHPDVRRDFPGGWDGDQRNAFVKEERTVQENEIHDFLRTLLNWRKDQAVIHNGKLTHYIPEDNVYVYFRHNDEKTVMVIMNGNSSEKVIQTERFSENIRNFQTGHDILGNTDVELNSLKVPAMTAVILELK